jgi:hypothetical protein
MPNDSSTEKMKTSDTISSLETKLCNMKDEHKSLEQQLFIFRDIQLWRLVFNSLR